MSTNIPWQLRSRNKASPSTTTHGGDQIDTIQQGVKQLAIDTEDGPARGTKHRRTPSQEEQALVCLSKAAINIKEATKILHEAGSVQLESATTIQELIEDLQGTVKSVDDYKNQPGREEWSVIAISLSKLTADDILSMGLGSSEMINAQDFKELVSRCSPLGETESLAALDKWSDARLTAVTDLLERHTGGPTEARRRLHIDQYILAAMELLDLIGPFILVFPELTLAMDNKRVVFENESQRQAFLVAGRTDYFVATISQNAMDDPPNLSENLEVSTSYSIVRKEVAKLGATITFMLVEAKSGAETLRRHLPQAEGEAMVVLASTESEEHTFKFCLTNGKEWIFAILSRSGKVHKCWVSETLTDKNSSITDRFKAFIIWMVTPSSQIHKLLSEKDTQTTRAVRSAMKKSRRR